MSERGTHARNSLWALPRTSRRGFLRAAGLTVSLQALSSLRALPAAGAEAEPRGSGSFFSPAHTEVLTQVVERMVETGDPAAPAVRKTSTIATLDRIAAHLDPTISSALPVALSLFEWGPPLFDFHFSRFTRLTPEQQDRHLEGWRRSRFALRRNAFDALRNLAFLGYYSQDETWAMIGYKGPLLGRRPGGSPPSAPRAEGTSP